jgi:hypothetical protein
MGPGFESQRDHKKKRFGNSEPFLFVIGPAGTRSLPRRSRRDYLTKVHESNYRNLNAKAGSPSGITSTVEPPKAECGPKSERKTSDLSEAFYLHITKEKTQADLHQYFVKL